MFASVAVTFPSTVMVVCPSGSTVHGTPANLPIEFSRLAAKAEERARGGGDVVPDGDRRRCALGVEEATGGDVDVSDDVDHGIGLVCCTHP